MSGVSSAGVMTCLLLKTTTAKSEQCGDEMCTPTLSSREARQGSHLSLSIPVLGLISMNDPVVSTFYSDPDGSLRRRRRRRHTTPVEVSPTTAYMSMRAQSMQNTARAAYYLLTLQLKHSIPKV